MSSNKQTVGGKEARETMVWVPGHASIPGDESADLLAKEGTIEPGEEDQDTFIGVSPSFGCGVARQWLAQSLTNA